ncbi:hypothetical protein BJ165DRAFT_1315656, partial [Panaeolus papilionaceus]
STFPPNPLGRQAKETIITNTCKAMDPSTFEESGCGVCGELRPMQTLSDIRHVKNYLKVLIQSDTTRIERTSARHQIGDIPGPTLNHSCLYICNDCRQCIRKGKAPKLALANGLWIGAVPPELQNLSYMEKTMIAKVRHSCAYVKIATGGKKMKANVVAFKSPIQKIY